MRTAGGSGGRQPSPNRPRSPTGSKQGGLDMRFDAAQRRQPIRGEPNVHGSQIALSYCPVMNQVRALGRCSGATAASHIDHRDSASDRLARSSSTSTSSRTNRWRLVVAPKRGGSARLFGARAMPTCRLLGLSGADNSRPAAEGDGAATSGWTNGRTLPRDLCLQLTPRLRADESRIVDVCDETPRPPTMVAAVSGAAAIPEPVRARRVSEPGWGGSAVKLRRVDSLSQLTSLVDMAARRRGGDGVSA